MRVYGTLHINRQVHWRVTDHHQDKLQETQLFSVVPPL